MPLNTAIPMGFQFPEIQGPLDIQQKALTLQGLIDQQQQRRMQMEEAKRKIGRDVEFRNALQSAKTPEERAAIAAQFAGPEALLTDAQRRTTAENNRQMAMARLQQVASQAQQVHEDRMSRLSDQNMRTAETLRHNRFMEGLSAHAQQVAGERLFYDTGQRVASPPQAQAPAAPNVPQGAGPVVMEAPDEQAALAQAQALMGRGQPFAVGVGHLPTDSVAGKMMQGGQTPAPQPPIVTAPSPQPTAPQVSASIAPSQRDVRLMDMAPPSPVSAPPAAPSLQMPPEIAAAPKKVQDQWKLKQTGIAGGGTLNPQTLQFVAQQYLAGDRQAIQGFARNATTRIALQNAIVDEAVTRGMSPSQVAAQIAEFAGTMAGSRTVGQRAANISLAATEAHEMLDIVKETSDKFGRVNFVPWNMALRAYESGTGSPEIAAFGASVNALVNVYARAINPTGVPTVSDKEHARAVLNTVQSPAQVDAVLGIIKRELEIAQKAPSQVTAGMRKRVTGKGQTAPATQSTGAVNAIEAGAKAAWGAYEPDVYEYRVNGGTLQRKKK